MRVCDLQRGASLARCVSVRTATIARMRDGGREQMYDVTFAFLHPPPPSLVSPGRN